MKTNCMKPAHKVLIAFSIFLVYMVTALNLHAQTTETYKGKSYTVQAGEKGGKFIVLESGEKHYISQQVKATDNGGTATYNGKQYPVTTGSKGGRYFLYNGNKIYLKKKT